MKLPLLPEISGRNWLAHINEASLIFTNIIGPSHDYKNKIE